MQQHPKLKIVNRHLNYDNVTLIEPSSHYYLQMAVEVDRPLTPFFFSDSATKKRVIRRCKEVCESLLSQNEVVQANVFKALLIPPGKSKYLAENQDFVPIARFDVAVLIEASSQEALTAILESARFVELKNYLTENSKDIHLSTATNARRIGEVNHEDQGVFLFNYFYAKDVEQNLAVWNYTAGWFEKETSLDNSTLLLPLEAEQSRYSVINHCRWDHLTDILPSLIFKKTFNTYVLDNFYENEVGAMPILYRLVK